MIFSLLSDFGKIGIGIVLPVILLIDPVPIILLDILIGLNLIFAFVLLLTALCVKQIKKFFILPPMIFVSTIYALVINISSARLILTNGLYFDGRLILFVSSLAAGTEIYRLVSDLAVFLIMIPVLARQKIFWEVVHISQVAASFTQESMPAKLMAIETDYSAGKMAQKEAADRKSLIQGESFFYSLITGSDKLVLGNIIAGPFTASIIILTGILLVYLLRRENRIFHCCN